MNFLEKDQVLKKSAQRLEFNQLLEFLAGLTKSDPGKLAALSLEPSQDLEKIRKDLGLLSEMIALINSGLAVPLGFFTDLSQTFENAKRGAMLSARELLEVLRMLEQADANKKFLKTAGEKFPGLGAIGDRMANLSVLKNRIDKTVDEHGEVRDSASPQLAGLRSEFAGLRVHIQRTLETMLGSQSMEDIIQDNFFTEREGRFVIPVKSHSQSKIPGIIHDSSASGATVFLEPIEMVPQNNRLRVLEREISSEIARILEQLTLEVAGAYDDLVVCQHALTELDLLQAKAELAGKLNASIPIINPDSALKLYKVRHPLLVLKGKTAIANDIVLDEQTRVLIISGPNTGGKTVFMKTLGIMALMLRAGMAIPAHPDSETGFFPEVYAEIGDDQSLSADLSSYSAHLLNLIMFMNFAGTGSLILVDEIFGSTDPEEASALAISILGDLRDRGCTTLVTTHISRLKAFAETEPGFKNASFEFDPEKLTPTYHLRIGIPGPSYGIATAQKLGLRPELVEMAQRMLEPESKRIMDLVSQLDRKQALLDQRLRRLAEQEQVQEAARKKIDARSVEIAEKEKALNKELRRKLEGELLSIRVRLNQIYEQARISPAKQVRDSAGKKITEIKQEIEQKYPEPEQGQVIAAGDWQAGDIAWVSKLRLTAKVLKVDQEEAEATLAVGSIRLKEKLSGLRRTKTRDDATPKGKPVVQEEPAAPVVPVQTPSNTLDLRGERAEEAELALIDYLDRSAREGKPAVFIIHGHGTGVLKKLVREYVASSTYVLDFRPGGQGEGGDGVTVAFLERMRA
jgi:DNA mismatch repair protein MutS2